MRGCMYIVQPFVLPARHPFVRRRYHRRIHRPHLSASKRPPALHHRGRVGPLAKRSFMTRAVVFAYHNVGVRCLSVLLAHNIDVALVVTHTDNPTENIWFDSVERLASVNRLPCATPSDPNTPEWIERIRALQPD